MPITTNKSRECEYLETYLDSDLTANELEQFTAHLAQCETCSTAVEQQQWLDSLLQEADCTATVPNSVYSSIELAITRSRRRRRVACGLAAAATLLIALNLPTNPKLTEEPQQAEPTFVTQPTPPAATFVGSDDMIVVQHDSPYPNVTIVEVFPTVAAQRRWNTTNASIDLPTPQQIPGDPS